MGGVLLKFCTRVVGRDIFATCGSQNANKCEKSHRANFTPPRYLVFFLLRRAGVIEWQTQSIGHAHTQTRPGSLRRHPIITKMDNKSSDGRGDGVECTRQAGFPVAREGRIPGMPKFSSTSATSSQCCSGGVAL